tara:strand:+ start:3787 stop:4272 length:486 start_codon:yes stop_codon:yes gene_type:complete
MKRFAIVLLLLAGCSWFQADVETEPNYVPPLCDFCATWPCACADEEGLVAKISAADFEWVPVYFAYDSAQLDQAAAEVLSTKVAYLEVHSSDVLVYGYTDDVGSVAYNIELGKARAEAVRNYLVCHGIDPSRICHASVGEFAPASVEDPSLNRRVEFYLED